MEQGKTFRGEALEVSSLSCFFRPDIFAEFFSGCSLLSRPLPYSLPLHRPDRPSCLKVFAPAASRIFPAACQRKWALIPRFQYSFPWRSSIQYLVMSKPTKCPGLYMITGLPVATPATFWYLTPPTDHLQLVASEPEKNSRAKRKRGCSPLAAPFWGLPPAT